MRWTELGPLPGGSGRCNDSTNARRGAAHEVTMIDNVTHGQYATRIGERSTIRLADGSVVTLDTASRVSLDLTTANREVHLLGGQANFEVAKDKARPFVVYAGDRRITAVGTAFDVRLD